MVAVYKAMRKALLLFLEKFVNCFGLLVKNFYIMYDFELWRDFFIIILFIFSAFYEFENVGRLNSYIAFI